MSEFASIFEKTSVASAKLSIENGKKFVLFIGRPSCPYCQLFEPKLSNVVSKVDFPIYYISSEDSSQLDEVQAMRRRYGIATVPALFVSVAGAVKVVCDSSLSEEDILDFIS